VMCASTSMVRWVTITTSSRSRTRKLSSSAAEAPLFAVEGLSVRYGGFQALRDVSWSVAAGRILGVIGPNGAGKSTCFMAATNMTPHSGRLRLDGADVTQVRAHKLPRLGLRRT